MLPDKCPRVTPGVWLLCLALVQALACTPFQVPVRAPPPPKFYAADFSVTGATLTPSVRNQAQVLRQDLSGRLAPGQAVVVLPPDSCRAIKVGASGDQVELAAMKCGTLISTIEVELAKQGYRVISWQTVRSDESSPARIYAAMKERGAELVIEIDQFSVGKVVNNKLYVSKIGFYESTLAGERLKDVAVDSQTRLRCRSLGDQLAAKLVPDDIMEAVLAAKAVDLSSGMALWYYSRSEFIGAQESAVQRKRLFQANGTAVDPPMPYKPGAWNLAQTVGYVLGMTSPLWAIPYAASEGTESQYLSYGAVSLASGVVLGVAGNLSMRSSIDRYAALRADASYPTADATMCLNKDSGVVPVLKESAPSEWDAPETSDVSTRREIRRDDGDPRVRAAISQIGADFAQKLRSAAGK